MDIGTTPSGVAGVHSCQPRMPVLRTGGGRLPCLPETWLVAKGPVAAANEKG